MARICNLLCIALIAIFTIVTADYCNLKSCDKEGSHTMCQFDSSKPADKCGESYSDGLSDDEKNEIVNTHNEMRQKVASGQEGRGKPTGPQPKAASMPNLSWDNELAKIAQRWANQCDFKHDECRNVDSYVVGQNIASTSNSAENKSTMKSMIEMWYNEVKDFNTNDVSSYKFDPNTGHYSQIVWAKTTKIGCGLISYKENGWNKKNLVCNYGPSGNYENEEVYKVK